MKEITLKGIVESTDNNLIHYKIEMPKKNGFRLSYISDDYMYITFEKEEILDDIEKEYLRAVIKPFRDKVKYIKKNVHYEKEFIDICMNAETIGFPYFKKGTMYKGMEKYKEYTLEELGL